MEVPDKTGVLFMYHKYQLVPFRVLIGGLSATSSWVDSKTRSCLLSSYGIVIVFPDIRYVVALCNARKKSSSCSDNPGTQLLLSVLTGRLIFISSTEAVKAAVYSFQPVVPVSTPEGAPGMRLNCTENFFPVPESADYLHPPLIPTSKVHLLAVCG